MLVVLFITGCIAQAQSSITVLSMGFGKDFINGQPLINANFIIKNAYASYSLSIDNTVKNYDVGWTFRVKKFYFAPTLGVTCVNKDDTRRYYLQTVTDENITIVEINVNAENGNTVVNAPVFPPIVLQGSSVISVIDRIDSNTKNHPNLGLFVGYQFNDGLTLFLKGTNNSFGFGMGYIIGSMF